MPFRKALKRDVWEQSPEAVAIGEQWTEVRKQGAKLSFSKDTETDSDPQ